jgi:hypothetical protein
MSVLQNCLSNIQSPNKVGDKKMNEEEAKKAYEQLPPEAKVLLQGAVFEILKPIVNEILERYCGACMKESEKLYAIDIKICAECYKRLFGVEPDESEDE